MQRENERENDLVLLQQQTLKEFGFECLLIHTHLRNSCFSALFPFLSCFSVLFLFLSVLPLFPGLLFVLLPIFPLTPVILLTPLPGTAIFLFPSFSGGGECVQGAGIARSSGQRKPSRVGNKEWSVHGRMF